MGKYFDFFTHSFTDGCLDWFHIFTKNNDIMNLSVHVSLYMYAWNWNDWVIGREITWLPYILEQYHIYFYYLTALARISVQSWTEDVEVDVFLSFLIGMEFLILRWYFLYSTIKYCNYFRLLVDIRSFEINFSCK